MKSLLWKWFGIYYQDYIREDGTEVRIWRRRRPGTHYLGDE